MDMLTFALLIAGLLRVSSTETPMDYEEENLELPSYQTYITYGGDNIDEYYGAVYFTGTQLSLVVTQYLYDKSIGFFFYLPYQCKKEQKVPVISVKITFELDLTIEVSWDESKQAIVERVTCNKQLVSFGTALNSFPQDPCVKKLLLDTSVLNRLTFSLELDGRETDCDVFFDLKRMHIELPGGDKLPALEPPTIPNDYDEAQKPESVTRVLKKDKKVAEISLNELNTSFSYISNDITPFFFTIDKRCEYFAADIKINGDCSFTVKVDRDQLSLYFREVPFKTLSYPTLKHWMFSIINKSMIMVDFKGTYSKGIADGVENTKFASYKICENSLSYDNVVTLEIKKRDGAECEGLKMSMIGDVILLTPKPEPPTTVPTTIMSDAPTTMLDGSSTSDDDETANAGTPAYVWVIIGIGVLIVIIIIVVSLVLWKKGKCRRRGSQEVDEAPAIPLPKSPLPKE